AARVSRITAETNNAISKDIAGAYEYHSRVVDRAVRRFDEEIRGQTTVVNPDTGDVYTTEAGHTTYWLHQGKVVHSNSPWSPGVDYSPLLETDR
ncbi:MAG TPA: hypothetical protein VKT32_16140, partial [Chthonomonadaceae bacterium]|nr:hypothetical protein [Chthonomonadaceae bacterium]